MQSKIEKMRKFLKEHPTATIRDAEKSLNIKIASSTFHQLKTEGFNTGVDLRFKDNKKPKPKFVREKRVTKVEVHANDPSTSKVAVIIGDSKSVGETLANMGFV